MIREKNSVYIEDKYFYRVPKTYDNKYFLEVKKELNKLHDSIIRLKGTHQSKVPKKLNEDELNILQQLEEERAFWLSEMSKCDNNISHKSLKHSCKKYSEQKLYEKTIECIEKLKKEECFYICKENIAFNLNVRKKYLDKIFMRLNREGILSQAKHRFMHDSNRCPGYETLSYDYTKDSDWAADYYVIR